MTQQSSPIDIEATNRTRARYQRISSIYNRMEAFAERYYQPWRKSLWSMVSGNEVLKVGVGTGFNIPYYPPDAHMTGIDLTPGMLQQAQERAEELNHEVTLRLGDVQALDFPDHTFDMAVATFVFCSVPDPVLGLRELGRVVKPTGKIFLLEHMRADNALLGWMMDAMNPFMVRLMGANINRRTVANVEKGLHVQQVQPLAANGIFKLIVAHPEPE